MRQSLKQSERLRFGVALLLGAAICLWTNDPVPGVVLAALQTGWNSAATGIWLLRFDDQRARARCCFLFHLATSCWQVSAASLISLLWMAAVEAFLGVQPNMPKVFVTLSLVGGGIALSSLMGLLAVGAAFASGVRVWIHPKLRDEMQETSPGRFTFTAADGPQPNRFNYAIFILGTSLVLPPALLGTALLMATTAKVDGVNPIAAALSFAVVFGGPILMIVVYAMLSPRIIAASPWQCWPAGTLGLIPKQELRDSRRPFEEVNHRDDLAVLKK